jgi:hypothetical protein
VSTQVALTKKFLLMSNDYDFNAAFKKVQPVIKIFDADGNVCEDSVVACRQILSYNNVTIFFYDDRTIQIMVDHLPMYHLPLFSM